MSKQLKVVANISKGSPLTGSAWVNVGQIVGPIGPTGPTGANSTVAGPTEIGRAHV